MDKFDTHKFLYTLFHENRIKGHKIVYIDRDNIEKTITINSIEIGASPVTCKIFNEQDKSYRIPFIRIKKVLYEDDIVWENTDMNLDDVKIIKGYE